MHARTKQSRSAQPSRHAERALKRQFGYLKVRFKGLAKNTAQLPVLLALVNRWPAGRPLLEMTGSPRL